MKGKREYRTRTESRGTFKATTGSEYGMSRSNRMVMEASEKTRDNVIGYTKMTQNRRNKRENGTISAKQHNMNGGVNSPACIGESLDEKRMLGLFAEEGGRIHRIMGVSQFNKMDNTPSLKRS